MTATVAHCGGGGAVRLKTSGFRHQSFATSSPRSQVLPVIVAGLVPAPQHCRVTPQPDGGFHFGGDVDALLLGVAGPETWDAPHTVGPVWANLVAWRAEAPGRWWLEVGDWPLLGWSELQRARFDGEALMLFGTPAAWAASGGRGCCVISWQDFDAAAWFRGLRITCVGHAVEYRLHYAIAVATGLEISRAAP